MKETTELDPFAGIEWPTPKIAVPITVLETRDRLILELVEPLSERIEHEVTPDMRWLDRVDYVIQLVSDHAPTVSAAIRQVLESASPKEQVQATTDALLRLAKWIESRVNILPSWIEWAAWWMIKRGVTRIAKRVFREVPA